MAMFSYQAMNNRGDTVKDEIEAANKEDAANKLRQMGLYPTRIRERAAKGSAAAPQSTGGARPRKKGQSLTIGGVSAKNLSMFTRQLATLQDAGLPVVRSIKVLENQQKQGTLKNALIDIGDDVEGGSTLSEAMSKHPKCFDNLYVSMVRAGEIGGVLDTMLNRLADFKERAQALKRKVIGAMVYPAAVIFFAVLIVFGLMVFVVPKFTEMFEQFGDDALPGPTRLLIATSDFMIGNIGVVLLIPVCLVVLFTIFKKTGFGRNVLDNVKMYVPLAGPIIRKSLISRFARTFGTLIQSGVPILEALNIVKDTSGNVVLSRSVTEVHDSIREGESIAEPLRQSRIFDTMVVNMIDVGEETGDVDKMLLKVADTYDEEVNASVSAMVSMLEPIMIIVLGVLVGGIVIALFLPLITLIQNMGQQGAR